MLCSSWPLGAVQQQGFAQQTEEETEDFLLLTFFVASLKNRVFLSRERFSCSRVACVTSVFALS